MFTVKSVYYVKVYAIFSLVKGRAKHLFRWRTL
jgi:hypothetical protein